MFLPKKSPTPAELEMERLRSQRKLEITTKLQTLQVVNDKLEAVVKDTSDATQELAQRLHDREPTMNEILISPEELFGAEEQVRKEIAELEAKIRALPPVPAPPIPKP